jgi:predicted phosphoribosyltransferase
MTGSPLFRDRQDAGNQIAEAVLTEMARMPRWTVAPPVVYALPKGGIPVAESIALRLNCPIDIIVAKKVTRPENPELAIGAVTADGHVIRSRKESFTRQYGDTWRIALEAAQLKAQAQWEQLREVCPESNPAGATAILVDDGIATGMTMAVAARSLRAKRPANILICAPVAPKRMIQVLQNWSDRVIVLSAPDYFLSVSRFYEAFPQVEMDEAMMLLKEHNQKFMKPLKATEMSENKDARTLPD